MIPEEAKYRSDIFKIAGIALVTPFAKLIINPIGLYKDCGLWEFLYYLPASILLGYLGILTIERGRVILDFWGKKKWKQ